MKLTTEKLTQIIREEVENVMSEDGVGAAHRGYNSMKRRSPRERWADNSDPAYTPRKQRPGVSEETFDKIIDAISELPGTPGTPEKDPNRAEEQGAGFAALRDFFLANEDFYKELVRQAGLAWVKSKPEDKITDALHAKKGLYSKLDPQLFLHIIKGVNPAGFAHRKGKKETQK